FSSFNALAPCVAILEPVLEKENDAVTLFDPKSEVESIVENTYEENEVSFSEEAINSSDKEEVSGDLKEFGVDIDEPDLFNSDIETKNSDDLLGSSEEDQEDDDLEIPAFLRRQKN
ncbi:hypothetical protein IDG48_05070, partial [Pelagibacterales bacterium SAG-MED12]|nr:hypothetical protein [Pelagibacterales bacterium SAG-MED12]